MVKRTVPQERMLILSLSGKGFGWEELCPFLDKPIPDVPYPKGNDQEHFRKLVRDGLRPGMRRAMFVVGSTAAAIAAGVVWYVRS